MVSTVPASWLLGICLAMLPCLAGASGEAVARPSAAAFDLLAGKIERGELIMASKGDVQRSLAQLRSLVPAGDVRRELRYRYTYCILGMDSDPSAGIAYADKGIGEARRIGYVDAEVNFHFCRGSNQESLTTPRDALADYNAGIELARHSENLGLVADGLTWRGSVQSLLGEHGLALVDFLDAQKYYDSAGLTAEAQQNLFNIAVAYRRTGERDKSRMYLDKLLQLSTTQHNAYQLVAAHMELGFLDNEGGRPEIALTQFRQALAISRQVDSPAELGSAHLGLAQALNQKGSYDEALVELDKAQSAFARNGDRSNRAMIALQTAEAHAGLKQYPQAIREYDEAEKLLRPTGNLRYISELLDQRSKSYAAMGRSALALKDLQQMVKVHEALDRKAQAYNATLLSYQFDTEHREQENRQLAADRKLKDQQLAYLERVRRWQGAALALGALLILLLLWLARRQVRTARKLHRMAMTDPLTGIANRRRIEAVGEMALDHAVSVGEPMAVLALDVDHFKPINDVWGHQVGDQVLVRIVEACRGALRQIDRLGRMGGEEFMVVLPGTGLMAACEVAERLRNRVRSLDLADLAPGLQVSISLGVADLRRDDDTLALLIQRADRALYRAKDAGRDRVEAASCNVDSQRESRDAAHRSVEADAACR